MKCPKCETPLVIDEWNGWVWLCFHCEHEERKATDEECSEQEQWYKDEMALRRIDEEGIVL